MRGCEPKLVEIVRDIAAVHSIAQGDLVAVALRRCLEQYEAGEVDLRPLLVPHRQSLKCKHRLELPEKWC